MDQQARTGLYDPPFVGDKTETTPSLSVCIVTGRRIGVLSDCLASLQLQENAPPFELLVAADADEEVAATVRAYFPDAEVCLVNKSLPGAARNLLVERARGDLLLFLDDDVTVDERLLERLTALARRHPEVGVFGGPNDTPRGSSQFQVTQGAVLASIVGSGPVRRRYGSHPARLADERFFTLCNLAIRREVMVPFADDLVCAEENGVLAELAHRGVAMLYDPGLVAYHERRATLRGFLVQMHKYGRGRGQLLTKAPRDVRPSFLAPTLLLAYLLASPLLIALAGPAALIPLAVYLVAATVCGAWIALTLRRLGALPVAAALIVLLHVAYGSGLPRGAFVGTGEEVAPVGDWLAMDEPRSVPSTDLA